MGDTPTSPTNPAHEMSPPSTFGYGPREDADSTRQAQHMAANDTPVDVNMNSVVCRSQALTFDALGKNFEANGDRRNKIMDAILGKIVNDATKP